VRRLIHLLAIALALAGCAGAPTKPPVPVAAATPVLRLSPASLGHELSVQQQLEFVTGDRHQVVDALLEVDATEIRLALLAAGQTALRLRWDGNALQETRAPWLPPALSSERVLSDLQWVQWPAEAIRATLPAGWSLREDKVSRQLLQADEVVLDIRFPSPGVAELDQRREHYQLRIRSLPDAGATR